MKTQIDRKAAKVKAEKTLPSFTKPVWTDQTMSCDACDYNGQDIDTFPCAKCHTRH